jgi:HEPN domain-containing protein
MIPGSFTCTDNSALYLHNALITRIVKAASPDFIFLLASTSSQIKTESIFHPTAQGTQEMSNSFFLVLIPGLSNKELHDWQDKIETHCRAILSITALVLQTDCFEEWLTVGHKFALIVMRSAPLLYNSGNHILPVPEQYNIPSTGKDAEMQFNEGLSKSKEFLAGSELYQVRKHHGIAAFMLHQATEQALRALVKAGTGYHANTHSIDRLLRYAGLVCPSLVGAFSQTSEEDKRLFQLLQKAYIATRYKEDYKISGNELLLLTGKTRHIQQLALEAGKQIFSNNQTNDCHERKISEEKV